MSHKHRFHNYALRMSSTSTIILDRPVSSSVESGGFLLVPTENPQYDCLDLRVTVLHTLIAAGFGTMGPTFPLRILLYNAHGDYVRLAIPAHPDQPMWETGEYYWPEDLDHVFEFPDDDATSFLQPLAIHWKLDSKDIIDSATIDQCARVPNPEQALLRAHGQEDEFALRTDPLWELWNRPALRQRNLQNEPVMIFETWFISGEGFPRCSYSRDIALSEDVDSWVQHLRHVWRDRARPRVPVELAIVHPSIAHARHGGHLILMQSIGQAERAALLSSFWGSRDGALQDRFAQLVPRRLDFGGLIQFNDLDIVCGNPDFDCQAFVGPHSFTPDEVWPMYHGMHLEVVIEHIPLRTVADALQVEHDGLDFDEPPAANEQQVFQHDSTSSTSLTPPLSTMSEFVQDPYAQWSHVPEDWKEPDKQVFVRVLHNALTDLSQVLPAYIELPGVYSAQNATQELASWGFDCRTFLCGAHDVVFAHFASTGISDLFEYILCGPDTVSKTAVFYRCADHPLSEHDHMKYLHKKGFTKAVMVHSEEWDTRLTCLHFDDVQPQFEARAQVYRPRTPWPTCQPLGRKSSALLPDSSMLSAPSNCLLQLDLAVLQDIQVDHHLQLWRDYTILDLPDFIRVALDQCINIQRCDRYIIFTDGSSQTKHRHRPPEWIAEHDLSDSWAFAVFAEQYSDDPHQPSQLQFLGFQCQQVLYEQAAAHHIGTTRIGSDASETEALFWAGLWRLSRNDCIPTEFVSDSRLVGDQAAGRIGSQIGDLPYQHLRALFQALAEGLPSDSLRVEHVRPVLRHLWMIVSNQADVPQLTQRGLDLSPPALPVVESSEQPQVRSKHSQVASFALGVATANVRTFYRSSSGLAGKLAYVREQFAAHHLSFIGIQEAPTEAGSSLHNDILRLAGGADKGQLGVELWANLAQPFAWHGRRPCYFKRSDFVVLSAHPRHLLVHVKNEMIEVWLLIAHAPHSGCDPDERLAWW
eukprot:s1820_g18.t1